MTTGNNLSQTEKLAEMLFDIGVFQINMQNQQVKRILVALEITNAVIEDNTLSFTVFRDEGADVYGSFLIGIRLLDNQGNTVFEQTQSQLSSLSGSQIQNDYVAQVKAGKHSLILPLGARARLRFQDEAFRQLQGTFRLQLLDISGAKWEASLVAD